jgi:hypothetical protein
MASQPITDLLGVFAILLILWVFFALFSESIRPWRISRASYRLIQSRRPTAGGSSGISWW